MKRKSPGFKGYTDVMKIAQAATVTWGLQQSILDPVAFCPLNYWQKLGAKMSGVGKENNLGRNDSNDSCVFQSLLKQ